MSNVLKRAKALRKNYPNKTWQQVVKIAAGKQTSSSKQKAMPARKKTTRKASGGTRRRRVGAVTTTTRRKVTTSTRRRKSVGAIIDNTMPQLALGMALTGVAQGLIAPLRSKVPPGAAKFVDPAIAILAYKGSTMFKNNVVKGVMLGLMKSGVDGSVGVIMAALGKGPTPMTPSVIQPQAQQQAAAASGYSALPMMGADVYMPLPAPALGEIRNYLAGAMNDNAYATIPPNEGSSEFNMPIGWRL